MHLVNRSSVRFALLAALAAAVSGAASASGATAGSVRLEQFVSVRAPARVTIVVRRPASFSILLRTRTQGRTQLFLLGKRGPSTGGPLLDTATTACEGAAGSFYCRGSYEPLPPGTYAFKVVRRTGPGTTVELSVRW